MSFYYSLLAKKLSKLSKDELEEMAKKIFLLKVNADFSVNRWKKVEKEELVKKLAMICFKNKIYVEEIHTIQILYHSKDDFIIQKSCGSISYYTKLLNRIITEYGFSAQTNFHEIKVMAKILTKYLKTPYFRKFIQYPNKQSLDLLDNILEILPEMCNVDNSNQKKKEIIKNKLLYIQKQIIDAESGYFLDLSCSD